VQVPVIGQGTWQLRDAAGAAAALEEGIRLGMTHIDTAELYERNTKSESILGPVVHRHRAKLFLASKVMPHNATAKGVPSSCKDSLVRLQTDHLDLYYHHWPDPSIPISETMRAIADLVDNGWVRFIGVSNYDVDDLEEAKATLGPGRIAANQVLYHLEDRGIESEVLPWCKANKVALVGYSPFGQGRWIRSKRGLALLDDVAARLGKTPRQVALAFLTRDASTFAIPKAEHVEYVRDNAGGAFDLPREAIARLDEAFPAAPGLRTA
jgi:diketogulonate reductase-like aldo/keto reductase